MILGGFEIAIKNPVRNDLLVDSFTMISASREFFAVRILSIPVYIKMKKPNNQRNDFINSVVKNYAAPK